MLCIQVCPSKVRNLRPPTDEASLFSRQFLSFACASRFAGRLPLPMRLDELDYHLPREQIAQRPLDQREASRLLLLDGSTGAFEDRFFAELPSLLRGNELLVRSEEHTSELQSRFDLV